MGKNYPNIIKLYSLVTAILFAQTFFENMFNDYETKCENMENWAINFAYPFQKTEMPFIMTLFITPCCGFNIEPNQNVNSPQLQFAPPGGVIDYTPLAGDNNGLHV